MQRMDANRLRFQVGELGGVLPDEFVWEQHLLSQFIHGADFRTEQGDYLRFVTDAGHVFCDVVPHDLPNDWSVPIDEAVAKAVAAVKRVVQLKEFERLTTAFHILHYLLPFLERWYSSVLKDAREEARAYASDVARRAVKAMSQ
jgi:hypothetical protein